ncbi:MAG: gamma-glutamyltransferase [Aquificae bacterium]|nr:gamma-glutamyltransferase [Aquificota bacterium]
MKGVISAGDIHTANAGAQILKKGGNAFDAVIGAVLVAVLAEPALTSLGGGGFLLAYPSDKNPVLYDFFVDVPPKRIENPDFYPVYVDFGNTIQEFHIGYGSIAVPGTLAGLYRVHQELGKLPLEQIIEPAVKLAKEGFYLSKMQASFVKLLEPIFTATEEARKVYLKDGKLIDEKTKQVLPQYAEFLQEFAKKGAWIFYEGEIADTIDNISKENKGLIRKKDLSIYKVVERKPLEFEFRDFQILTNPPPSSGGILISFSLKLLEQLSLGRFGSIEHIKTLIETLHTTSIFRKEYIDKKLPFEDISISKEILNQYKKTLNSRLNLWGNTTHISVIDEENNAVSITTTNGEGSGVVIKDTGIMLNNMLGEEDLNPKGFFKWPPYIRLPSMMSPTVVLKEKEPIFILGSAGSNRIRSAIVQVIINYLLFSMDIENAVNSPRIHFENGTVYFEPGFEKQIIKKVEKLYKVVEFTEKSLFFGGVQAVNNHFEGSADSRRGGYVIKVR